MPLSPEQVKKEVNLSEIAIDVIDHLLMKYFDGEKATVPLWEIQNDCMIQGESFVIDEVTVSRVIREYNKVDWDTIYSEDSTMAAPRLVFREANSKYLL